MELNIVGGCLNFLSCVSTHVSLSPSQHPRPPSSRPYSLPSSSSASLSVKPSTATVSLYPSSSSHSSSTHHHVPVWTSPLDKQVPLRGFEVPAETLKELKPAVLEQRRAVQAAGNKVLSREKERPHYGKPGFYALSESECLDK